MEELHKFVFGTIVCDGCGRRIDSHNDDEWLHDLEELEDCYLDDWGWVEQSEDKWLCPDCVKDPNHRTHPGEGRIIVERDTLSGLRCDHCGKQFEDSEGYSSWTDSTIAEEMARDDDWREVGGKMLCPDCYKTCPAMEDESEEDYEEIYCNKCPHKNLCDEVVECEIPIVSQECKVAVKVQYEQSKRRYEPCPYYLPAPIGGKCNLPKGKTCPRVETWTKVKGEVEQKNREIQEWVKQKD